MSQQKAEATSQPTPIDLTEYADAPMSMGSPDFSTDQFSTNLHSTPLSVIIQPPLHENEPKFREGDLTYVLDLNQSVSHTFGVVDKCYVDAQTGSFIYDVCGFDVLWKESNVPEHCLGPIADRWERPKYHKGEECAIQSNADGGPRLLLAIVVDGKWDSCKKWQYRLAVKLTKTETIIGEGRSESDLINREQLVERLTEQIRQHKDLSGVSVEYSLPLTDLLESNVQPKRDLNDVSWDDLLRLHDELQKKTDERELEAQQRRQREQQDRNIQSEEAEHSRQNNAEAIPAVVDFEQLDIEQEHLEECPLDPSVDCDMEFEGYGV